MHKQGCILAVMRPDNGSYPERDGKVYVPRHERFNIRIKNNNSVPVEVKLRIGGLPINSDDAFRLDAFDSVDFKNLTAVQPGESTSKNRGTSNEVNVIEAEFRKLQAPPATHEHHHHYYSRRRPYYCYPWEYDYSYPPHHSWPISPIYYSDTTGDTSSFTCCADTQAGGDMDSLQSNITPKELSQIQKSQPVDKKLKIETDQMELPDLKSSSFTLHLEIVEGESLPNTAFCTHCGQARQKRDHYCSNCGARLK